MMDLDEIALVRVSFGQLLACTDPAEVPTALVDSGWVELLDVEPAVAIGVLADEQGRARVATPVLDLVMLHGAGLPIDATTAIVLPPLRRRAERAATGPASGLVIDGLALGGHERAERFLVASEDGIVVLDPAAVELSPVSGGDVALGLCRAVGSVDAGSDATVAPASAWGGALAAGRRFLAGELIGVSETMLATTVEYVLARHQFGRPIGAFQAVKHRLADVRVAISAAQSALDTAWADADPLTAMAAKCLAGRAHRVASTHCHQVHGGIAFTVDHGFHRFIRRGHMLDALLGSADHLTREIGEQLLAVRRVPRTPQLRSPAVADA